MKLRPATRALVLCSAASLITSGCGHTFRKPWGKGTYIPAAICTVVGAGAGIGIQEARRGTSEASIFNEHGTLVGHKSVKDDAEYWKGALIGGVIGAAVCGLAGHYLLDPEPVPPPPPPPPPLPPAVAEKPLPPPATTRIILRGVQFDFNRSDIRPDSRPVLDEAADILKQNPAIRVSVEGHTDAIGTEEYNQKLSVQRAEAVFRYLVNHGIAPERMEVVGFGKTRPVATNDTDAGRAQNRRVELHVLGSNTGSPPPGE